MVLKNVSLRGNCAGCSGCAQMLGRKSVSPCWWHYDPQLGYWICTSASGGGNVIATSKTPPLMGAAAAQINQQASSPVLDVNPAPSIMDWITQNWVVLAIAAGGLYLITK